ncbi:C40 family peptidase [Streptomyces harbinensis]
MKATRATAIVFLAAGLSLPALVTVAASGAAGRADLAHCARANPVPAPDDGASAVVPLSPQGEQADAEWSQGQVRNAATITAVARGRSLPPRAAVVAVATAIQESSLRTLDHGDRDSVGLFQQRPSQGWGSAAQLRDPVYSSSKFYDALVRVPGWEGAPLTEVAQAVQRSAFPDAYARWEKAAGILVADTWGSQAVTMDFAACAAEAHGDPAENFSAVNPRSPVEAIAAARKAAGQTGWYRRCGQFVAEAYGYAYSGSATANAQWNRLHAAGLTHPDDTAPPAGALLFYETGDPAGHVALYLGDDLVASNDVMDSFHGEGKIAVVRRGELTDGLWRLRYLGWAEPVFPNAGGTGTI